MKKVFVDRYDMTTGLFTVPADGEGFYYFSVHIAAFSETNNVTFFDIQTLCSAFGQVHSDGNGHFSDASSSAVASVVSGSHSYLVKDFFD